VASPSSLYRIASISKPITAIAIMQLVENKKLKLSDKVVDVLKLEPFLEGNATPDPRWKEITIEQLLRHRGGFDRNKSFDAMFRSVTIANAMKKPSPASQEDVLRYMMGKPLDFNPGEKFAYSNLGYCILGRIIEKISAMTYNDYVQNNIFKPLDIYEIKPGRSLKSNRLTNEVVYYPPNPSKVKSVFPPYDLVDSSYGSNDHESLDSVGGWVASARALVKLASSLDDNSLRRVLGKEATATMFSKSDAKPELDKEGKPLPNYYGLGWNVRPVGQANANTWHNGSLSGTSTLLVRRHDGYTWAVLFNGSKDKSPQPSTVIDALMHKTIDSMQASITETSFSEPVRLKRLRINRD